MDFEKMIGLGVAGNFAGHLEQAGEARDFTEIKVKEANQPKGLFPFHVPHALTYHGIFPLSSDTIAIPKEGGNLQIEPEVALICEIRYQDKRVSQIHPIKFGAYNDCSIRKPTAIKISEKKNWGLASKGLSLTLLDIDTFTEGGLMDQYRIACYLKREGELYEYGIDSPISGYSYCHERLTDWIQNQMNEQIDEGPLEPISEMLKIANYPKQGVISIGSTKYTDFGESHFLQEGDESIVILYDGKQYKSSALQDHLINQTFDSKHTSLLIQKVISL
jgi:hypothetical protein